MTEHTGRAGDGTRRVILLIGMTLDGYNAGGWTPRATRAEDKTEMFDEVWRQLENVDTFLLGRVTFELWQRHWPLLGTAPSSSVFEKKFSAYIDGIQKVVYSHTLDSVSWHNSRLVTGSIAEDVARMKQTPGGDMVIAGGARIAAAFGAADLIDEYRLWLHPEIRGHGDPVLAKLQQRKELELLDAKTFRSGAVSLRLSER